MKSIGIDLGGTKIIVGLVDDKGNVLKSHLLKTRVDDGPAAIVEDIVSVSKDLIGNEPIDAIGIGVAGQIEKNTGTVVFAPNLGWKDFPLQKELFSRTEIPTFVTNDVRAATWGEWLYGAGQDCQDLLCIFVGTGIGGGVVSNGQMLIGATNTAGEIGHITIDLHGVNCACGNRGCFETLAGGKAIARRAKEAIVFDPAEGNILIDMAGGFLDGVTTKIVFEAYRKKLPLAIKIVEEVKVALVAGVTSLVNAFNPSRVIMGGGIMNGNPEFIEIIKVGVAKNALQAALQGLEIVPAALKNDAGVIGAAAYARTEVINGQEAN